MPKYEDIEAEILARIRVAIEDPDARANYDLFSDTDIMVVTYEEDPSDPTSILSGLVCVTEKDMLDQWPHTLAVFGPTDVRSKGANRVLYFDSELNIARAMLTEWPIVPITRDEKEMS